LTPSFWPGLRVLAHSLVNKGGITDLNWIVMTEKPVPDEWGDWLFLCGFGMQNSLLSEVGELPDKFPATAAHLKFNWNKLRILLLPKGEYVYLDADLLCVGDATRLLTMPSISAANEITGEYSGRINAGLIRFDPDRNLFDECATVIGVAVAAGARAGLAEQTVLNEVLGHHKGMVHILKDRWNLPAFLNVRKPHLWKPQEAVFLHFTGTEKPWMPDGDYPNSAKEIWRDYAKSIQEVPA